MTIFSFPRYAPLALAIAACTVAGAHAQTSSTQPSSAERRSSVLPYTQDGYIGLSGGRSAYSLNGGPSGLGLAYDDSDSAYKLYAGGFFHPNVGVELGYLNAGTARRLGGETKAHGFNLSLVGRAPLTEQFDVFGKIGTTYGRTRTSGLAATGVDRISIGAITKDVKAVDFSLRFDLSFAQQKSGA